jgi:hypothetical protein
MSKENKIMPNKGDRFETYVYCDWGTYNPKRYSHSRDIEFNEAYIPIPRNEARRLDIFMSNMPNVNLLYDAYDEGDNYICTLKAQGCSTKGDVFAKQFAGNDNLKALADWILYNEITDNDTIEVEFLSSNSLKLVIL